MTGCADVMTGCADVMIQSLIIRRADYFTTNTKLIKLFPTQRELKGLEARH